MPKKLKEGEDYIIENGAWIFTTKFHLDRGYCCKNKCLNCPYTDCNMETKQQTVRDIAISLSYEFIHSGKPAKNGVIFTISDMFTPNVDDDPIQYWADFEIISIDDETLLDVDDKRYRDTVTEFIVFAKEKLVDQISFNVNIKESTMEFNKEVK